jgi:hypothetical protein
METTHLNDRKIARAKLSEVFEPPPFHTRVRTSRCKWTWLDDV